MSPPTAPGLKLAVDAILAVLTTVSYTEARTPRVSSTARITQQIGIFPRGWRSLDAKVR